MKCGNERLENSLRPCVEISDEAMYSFSQTFVVDVSLLAVERTAGHLDSCVVFCCFGLHRPAIEM